MTAWDALSAQVDWPSAVKGASAGFSVLIIGFYAGPLMANVPVVGGPWLVIVAVLGFAVAAWRIGDAVVPPVHGAAAAVAAYLLFLPIIILGAGRVGSAQWQLIVAPFAIAVVVGWLTGTYRGRQRDY
ncbi:MAG: hypothetical protein ACT4RN_16020 [Pseudonocardia sp.]